ncbi:endonuclease [Bifidobacterium aemilianum]|uniref:Endonuclease n=1 Tax=Bifidobacterium aemilianum TaxID=2493120 RepID=A0A366K834_9BIFI|nr:endonuclease/exonuclease/phosphatase family protein [Bifidobacterium aemilianum]RBP97412.1 endonuclease [Bifidobacterium aemilianum]
MPSFMVWLLAVPLVCIAGWWSLRFLPVALAWHKPLPYAIALVRFLWLPALLLALLAGLTGHWVLAGLALMECLVVIAGLSPYFRRILTPQGHLDASYETADDLTVMTLNCRFGQARARDIIDALLHYDVDVLALQELSSDLVKSLESEGLGKLLPYRQLGQELPGDNGGFNGIWTRLETISSTPKILDIPAAQSPAITVHLNRVDQSAQVGRAANLAATGATSVQVLKPQNDTEITLVSTHPKSPMRGLRHWSDGITGLASLVHGPSGTRSSTQATSLIVMGDLNSGLDHSSFRSLLAAGFTDASLAQAQGFTRSFPSWIPWPRLELDHVLTTGPLSTESIRPLTIPGSDHLALIARLRFG